MKKLEIAILLISLFTCNLSYAACQTGYMPTLEAEQTLKYVHCDLESELPVTGLNAGDLLFAKDTLKFYTATSATEITAIGLKPTSDDQIRLSTSALTSAWTSVNDCDTATSAITYDTGTNTFGCNSITAGAGQTPRYDQILDAGTHSGLVFGAFTNVWTSSIGNADFFTIVGSANTVFQGDGDLSIGGNVTAVNLSGTNTGDQSEASIEAIVDLENLQGAVIDSQVPNNITIDTASAVEGTDLGTLTDTRLCTYDSASTEIDCDTVGGSGAPTTVDYLVGTADGGLSAEIVVGTSPGGELGNTWASPTVDDDVSVSSWNLTAPDIQAGSASADSWAVFSDGTVMTTAEDGAVEVDANVFYHTTDAGNRGYVPVRHFIRADSAETLTDTTAAQNLFDSPSNGRITLETGAYYFKAMTCISGMSATSGNAQILFGGTATMGSFLWTLEGIDATACNTLVDLDGGFHTTNATAASAVTAAVNTFLKFIAEGTFEVTGAGTVIPQIDLVTGGVTPSVAAGSYFMIERIGSTTAVSVGQWD